MIASVDRPLRITMVVDTYDTARNGVAISTQCLVRALSAKHQMKVVTTGQAGEQKFIVPMLQVPLLSRFLSRHEFCIAKPDNNVLNQAMTDTDIVHIHFPFWLGRRALSVARKKNIPVIATSHMQAEQIAYNLGIRSKRVSAWIYYALIKGFYNKVDHVIFPTAFAQEELMHYGFTGPSSVVSNGVDQMFQPQLAKHKDKFIILMVGRLAHEKRQEVLIQAIAQSQHKGNIQLILAGNGVRREELVRMGKSLPNPVVITYLPIKELVALYNQADLYVHTSELETECLTVLEAMACGVPIVVADSPKSATRQFALTEHSLFRTNDPQDLAQRIDYWYEHREHLSQAKQDYLVAVEQYRIEQSVNKLEKIYYELLG